MGIAYLVNGVMLMLGAAIPINLKSELELIIMAIK